MKTESNRWWDWPSVLCFLAAMLTAAYRLNDTQWTENLELVTGLNTIGAILGMVLGLSRFSRPIATLLGFGYSLVILPWQLSKIIPAEVTYLERLISVGGRLWTNFTLFVRNQPLTDSILFLATMALLFWLMAVVGGYNLTRNGKPWSGVIIGGIAILVIDIYHPAVGARGTAMAFYSVLALLLVTRMYFLRRKHDWDKEEVSVDSETGFTLSRGALITGIVLVLLAWNANTVVKAINPATPEHRQAINVLSNLRQRIENAVKPLRGTAVVSREYYGDQFALGSGAQLSDREVFTVETSIRARSGVPFYWRVRSYDTYQDGQWESHIHITEPLTSSFQSIEYGEEYEARLSVNFRFHPGRNLSMLYAPSMPVTISRPAALMADKAILDEAKTAGEQIVDVTAVVVDPIIRAGEVYEMVSKIPSPTVAQLRSAGTDYPAWTEKYLRLPDNFPASVASLAEEITAGLDNPYDQAAAITGWLRENIEYSQVLPAVPAGEDPIEWMLFTQKQAFCNYYATAEVLMLRHLGIPARWVVGYAQGEYDPEERIYHVRERDSHAWPEVFFPGYGWIELEPTASQSTIRRPSGIVNDATGDLSQQPPAFMDEGPQPDRSMEDDPFASRYDTRSTLAMDASEILRLVAIAAAILGIPLLAFWLYRRGKRNPQLILPIVLEKTLRRRGMRVPVWLRQWSHYVELTPMEKNFVQVRWMLNFLGVDLPESITPREQIRQLVLAVPEGEEDARRLLEEYHRDEYSPTPGDLESAQAAINLLWKLTLKQRGQNIGKSITRRGGPTVIRASRTE